MSQPGPPAASQEHGWGDEARDLIRGIGGAAIIGIPLVYTQETYDWASVISSRALAGFLLIALVVNVGYNLVSGFRAGGGWQQGIRDATESLGLGIVLAGVLLYLLGIVDGQTPLTDIATKIATEAVPLSLGVSVANTQFGGNREAGQDGSGEDGEQSKKDSAPSSLSPAKATLRDAGITLAGCIILAANIGPTEEIMRLATGLTDIRLLCLMIFSLGLSYGMIFEAGFAGQDARRDAEGLLQTPLGETLLAYAIALGVALVMTLVFHGVSVWESPHTVAACMIVLALPATIGGAAGRLVV